MFSFMYFTLLGWNDFFEVETCCKRKDIVINRCVERIFVLEITLLSFAEREDSVIIVRM